MCDCLDIQRRPAFTINVVRGIFTWFHREVCPICSPKALWETLLLFLKKNKTEQYLLTSSSVRGSLIYLSAR